MIHCRNAPVGEIAVQQRTIISCRHWCFFVWHVRHDIQLECGTTLVLFIIIVNYLLKTHIVT